MAAPALVYVRGYFDRDPVARALVPLTGLFLAALIGVVVARDQW